MLHIPELEIVMQVYSWLNEQWWHKQTVNNSQSVNLLLWNIHSSVHPDCSIISPSFFLYSLVGTLSLNIMWPCGLELWPSVLDTGPQVICHMGNLSVNFKISTAFCSWIRDRRNRQIMHNAECIMWHSGWRTAWQSTHAVIILQSKQVYTHF